jgi:hypothetical protein
MARLEDFIIKEIGTNDLKFAPGTKILVYHLIVFLLE